MKVLDGPIEFMTRLGEKLTPQTEADRVSRIRWSVVVLVVLAVIYYRLLTL